MRQTAWILGGRMTTTQTQLKPLGDRLVVKADEKEEKTASGIFLPDTAQEKPLRGTVLAAGPGRVLDNGTVQPLEVKAGDKILFGKYSGTEIKLDGESFLILKESEVLGVYTK
jgi:chaperonin GroES